MALLSHAVLPKCHTSVAEMTQSPFRVGLTKSSEGGSVANMSHSKECGVSFMSHRVPLGTPPRKCVGMRVIYIHYSNKFLKILGNVANYGN